MVYRTSIAVLLASATACGGDASVDSDFSKSESQALFSSTNAVFHDVHIGVLEEFGIEQWPINHVSECPGGGEIRMVASKSPDGTLTDLSHNLVNCVIEGRSLNGYLDYLDFESPDCGGATGVAFDISGELIVTGGPEDGACSVEARESCGDFSGKACGYGV